MAVQDSTRPDQRASIAAEQTPTNKPYTAAPRTMHAWALGAMADYMLYVSFGSLIVPIFTLAFGVPPPVVGLALVIPRLFDAVTDPFVGYISDNFKSRWGRRRPLLVFSAMVGSIALISLWWASPEWSQTVKFVWLTSFAILQFFCFGFFQMMHMALGYEMSDDYSIRTRVMALRGVYFSIASMLGGWLYWLVQRSFWGGEINGIRSVSIGMAAVILIVTGIMVANCKERGQTVSARRKKHMAMGPAFKASLRNKPFVIVLLMRAMQALSVGLYAQIGSFITIFYVCKGDKSMWGALTGYAGIIGFAFCFVLVRLGPWLTHKIGKRNALWIGFGTIFLGTLAAPFFHVPGRPYLLLAYTIPLSLISSVLSLFINSVMPDIIDIDELETGERREATFGAVMSFVFKLEASACVMISTALVTWAGFQVKLGGGNPPEVLYRMFWYGLGPKILFAGIAFLVALRFPLTEQIMADVRAKLDARKKLEAANEDTTL